jgi:hypothetical protein
MKETETKWSKYVALLTKESPQEVERKSQEKKFEKEKAEKEKYEALPEDSPARVKWERQQEKKKLKKRNKSGKKMMRM